MRGTLNKKNMGVGGGGGGGGGGDRDREGILQRAVVDVWNSKKIKITRRRETERVRQTDRQTVRESETDRQTDRQSERVRQTDRQTHRQRILPGCRAGRIDGTLKLRLFTKE